MNVLIVGGSGSIGAHVARHLSETGHKVAIFYRGQTRAELAPEIFHLLGEREFLLRFIPQFEAFAPEVVLDMCAYTEQDAHLLVQTFRGLADRVVCVSSMDVYRAYGLFLRLETGAANTKAFDEDAPLRRVLYPYRPLAKELKDLKDLTHDYEKILVENVVMNQPELPGTVLRLPQVFGPNDKQHRLANYLRAMDQGHDIILDEKKAHWRWTRGYVEDVAVAIALAVVDRQAAGRIYNVGDEKAQTEIEWIQAIGRAAGWNGKIRMTPREAMPKNSIESYDWSHDLAADTSRIRQEIGYREIVTRPEALRRTIVWERANPA